ncbi:vesicle-fusing ATPase 1-like [Argiope bruennichi]|uniref:Vesicle-fusing ATPase n=1 Tax=Argiope bruennichi TaxID=94029 RepID=A0A8T0EI13_ARGBR|nr:vesicle-fusing ATPase 1-like [Argiope bruennichi]KAF8773663.1 Vesicle-fusing ATPase 1 like protein [Argiope bruennichi]
MAVQVLTVAKCPTESLSFTNCAIVNEKEFPLDKVRHVEVTTSSNRKYVFTLKGCAGFPSGQIGFSLPMRKWAELSLNQSLEVRPYTFNPNIQYIAKIVLDVDFLDKKTTLEPYDTEKMASEFVSNFCKQAFTVGQMLAFNFQDMKLLKLVVREMEAANIEQVTGNGKSTAKRTTQVGLLLPDAVVVFEKAEGSAVNLVGKAKGKTARQSIINPDWDFQKMGIGGLDNEFNAIFRRAFASRVFPPEFVQQLGLKHVRGILLFGPPGTGKTLMARQIGKMLNAREPKIVNGPQILDKYVGESEANIRRLFADAEEEEKRLGPNSGLHIIIFDEIDAICKARGSMAGSSGVHDTVVNQLLAKIDGVESLNNILVIGMTNRKDMIDEALMRPGRLEVQMEIGLPDEKGRLQILNIHTAQMKKHNKMAEDVDLEELAAKTKNFSGAEIEGLVRAAQSTAMNRLIKASSKVEIDPEATEKIRVTRADFMHALEYDIKPAFGTSAEQIERLISQGIIRWGEPVAEILEDGQLFIQQARAEGSRGLVSVLIEGAPNSGKTALAAKLALSSDFPFVKLCTPEDMVGYSETAKCQLIKKMFDDAYKSHLSCIIVDSIERLLDYGAIGPRYSNLVLQALLVLLKKEPPPGRKLLVLCTSSRKQVLEEMEMLSTFTSVLRVPYLSSPEHLVNVLLETNTFRQEEIAKIQRKTENCRFRVGIKKLLAYIDLARQASDEHRVSKFLAKLEEENCLQGI